MNNFDFILNFDNSNKITHTNNELCYDTSFIFYFSKSPFKDTLYFIKQALLKKIIEKQIIYKNKECLEELNNCIDYCIKNLKNINSNNLYSNDEMEEIEELISHIISDNEKNNLIIENKLKEVNNNFKKNEKQDQNENENINSSPSNTSNTSNNQKQYTFLDKVYSIAIKIKNSVKTGFKTFVDIVSNYTRKTMNLYK